MKDFWSWLRSSTPSLSRSGIGFWLNRSLEWVDTHTAGAAANGNELEKIYLWSIFNTIISESDNVNDPMRSDSYLPSDWNEEFRFNAKSL